jgi:Zn-dependent peptidase ImmA (M78 family)/transcriptional regulator with XRE-family HTH domain
MNRVTVQPEMLRWARERADLTLDDLLKPFPHLAKWEEQLTQPTLRQLENYARRTWTPFGYFFLVHPPEEKLPIPDFRTLGDQQLRRPSPNLLDTIYALQRRQAWLRDYLIEEGDDPLVFAGSANVQQDPVAVAGRMREVLGLSAGWANEHATWTDALLGLRLKVETAGIVTTWSGVVGNHTRRILDIDEFRGFVLADEYAPFVFINTRDAKAAQMFTLVHELVHVWLGTAGVVNMEAMQPADSDAERFCNRVAAEVLVPQHEMEEAWAAAQNAPEPIQVLARRFKVSPLVVARRALELNYLDREGFFKFYNAYMEDDRRVQARRHEHPGGDFYATAPLRLGRPFVDAILRATREGKLLYRDAYQLTGLHGKTFDTLARKVELP